MDREEWMIRIFGAFVLSVLIYAIGGKIDRAPAPAAVDVEKPKEAAPTQPRFVVTEEAYYRADPFSARACTVYMIQDSKTHRSFMAVPDCHQVIELVGTSSNIGE